MASGGKKKTTFAKLAREQKLRERRLDKQAKKDARRRRSSSIRRHPATSRRPLAIGERCRDDGGGNA
jgi:hypothetical protein